ncbi:NAD(P)-dependent oxidoreductase [Anaerocolumna sp. AGMB13020]|uniref:NAD-dependent epimerase/dehydratase family protein n=1 Tax=Anaerocolumna sp. AGMB13020 TaxID=3081750 RepID=UPI0029558033|nr:NAD(P)-dependent oxidoreductase [Anaerocolumna sp. AGMB13020]WOO35453.1 NAD(P)-dependent oxidoreductase [Anaerocolumna sp. AGMB13020]
MKKVIIMGANGFIGSHLAIMFLKENWDVYCLVQNKSNFELDGSNIIEFELNKLNELEGKLPTNADLFYNLAWIGVSSTYKNDFEIQSQNIAHSLEALKLAEKLKCSKVIYPGSVSEYAYAETPVNGRNLPCPADMYSACKTSVHFICDLYSRQNNLEFLWVLIPSIYGPGREDNNIITYAIKTFLSNKKPSFTKLEQMWDYLYIDDLIAALYLLGQQGIGGKTYVVGTGNSYPLSKYIEIIRDIINPSLPMGIGELPYKTTKVDNSIVDITLLTEDTDYKPRYTFYQGIVNTIEYFKKNRNEGNKYD